MSKYKFILIGLLIGFAYLFGIKMLFENLSSKANSEYIMEKKVIDDRDALQPNNTITYEEETLVYSDKKIDLIHNFYSNSARDLVILTIAMWFLIDLIYYPEGRKTFEGWFYYIFPPNKKIETQLRLRKRENSKKLLFGIILSTILLVIINLFLKIY
jgi:hypothetical protein